jgi:hypothetical protein
MSMNLVAEKIASKFSGAQAIAFKCSEALYRFVMLLFHSTAENWICINLIPDSKNQM